jgi:glucans biosynthesis protein
MLAPEPKGAPSKVEVVASASQGLLENVSGYHLTTQPAYRAVLDIRPGNFTGPIDLRVYLRLDGRALSETWLYQWTPPALTAGSAVQADA